MVSRVYERGVALGENNEPKSQLGPLKTFFLHLRGKIPREKTRGKFEGKKSSENSREKIRGKKSAENSREKNPRKIEGKKSAENSMKKAAKI
jgi:hypothetical protein